MIDGDDAPDSPEGYQEPYEPVAAVSWWELPVGDVLLFVGTAAVFGGVTALVRDGMAVLEVFLTAVTLDSTGALGLYLGLVAAGVLAVVCHELVHGAAGWLLDCEVSFGRRGWGVGTRLRGGFLSRGGDVVVTLAPAVVLTVVGVVLLVVVVESPLAAAVVLTGLVANAAGIGSDLADGLALRTLPPGTLLYYDDATQFAYEPAAAG
jgi:hypothetical protein